MQRLRRVQGLRGLHELPRVCGVHRLFRVRRVRELHWLHELQGLCRLHGLRGLRGVCRHDWQEGHEGRRDVRVRAEDTRSLVVYFARWVAVTAVVLAALWCLGSATRADEPVAPKTSTAADVAALRARLAERHDWIAEAEARDAGRLAAARAAENARRAQVQRLAVSMRRFLEAEAPSAGARLAQIADVDGFAVVLVDVVQARVRAGRWVPLSREKAPAFLAAVAFHESSWRWRDASLRGARGEGCAMQVSPSAAAITGHRFERVVREPAACVEAAVDVMALCAAKCGDVPAESWLGCYASAGQCGAAPDVVALRFATARRLLED